MKRTPVGVPLRICADSGTVREASQDDAGRIREFVCGLSPLSQYLRFFASVAPPSTGLLRALCGATGADILVVTDGDGSVIGHGMAADAPSHGGVASNIGLVIADRWQEQGLGTLLLRRLIGRAARRGVSSLVLDVLPANARMLGIIDRRWPHAPRERTRDAIIIRPQITQQPTEADLQLPAVISLSFHHDQGVIRAPGRPAA